MILDGTVVVPSELASNYVTPLQCDSRGDLYLLSDHYGVSAIRKLSPKGEQEAILQPTAAPDLGRLDVVGSFGLGPDGDVYEIVFPHEITRYVIVYKDDGSYKRTIKLEPGFGWQPAALAVFPSGNFLITGQQYARNKNGDHVLWPFTGIFSADGVLLKEVKLEDDDALNDMASKGDTRVTDPTNPSSNHAVDFSRMQPAPDGNIYLMRWVTPAIVYAVSPGGEVVRRFSVDPGDASYRPEEMHISGNRIAIVFFHPQTKEDRMKIVDLEGHDIATYDEPKENGKAKFSMLSFACFTENPEHFTFLSTGDDHKLELLNVKPNN